MKRFTLSSMKIGKIRGHSKEETQKLFIIKTHGIVKKQNHCHFNAEDFEFAIKRSNPIVSGTFVTPTVHESILRLFHFHYNFNAENCSSSTRSEIFEINLRMHPKSMLDEYLYDRAYILDVVFGDIKGEKEEMKNSVEIH